MRSISRRRVICFGSKANTSNLPSIGYNYDEDISISNPDLIIGSILELV